jgi:hypothetical protein
MKDFKKSNLTPSKSLTSSKSVANVIDNKIANSPTPPKKGKSAKETKQEFLLGKLSHIELFLEVLDNLAKKSNKIPGYIPKVEIPLETIVRSTWDVYDSLIRHHGLKAGSKLWKEFRNYTLRQARGQPLTNLSVITATGKRDRVISKFHNLRPLIFASRDGCAFAYQILNSVLYSTRIDVRLPDTKKYSVEDVLYKFRCDPIALSKYRVWLRTQIKSGRFALDEIPKGKFDLELPLTSSSPRGGLNIETLEEQSFDLFKSELFYPFKNLCEHFGDADFPRYVQSLAEKLEKERPSFKAKCVRRITRVPDSDVKDRVIAIVDWCSQIVAARVQGILYKFLKRNLSEYTDIFNHGKGAMKVLSDDPSLTTFTSPGSEYILKCTDFDAWTWKFSREPQIIFMEEVVGKGISDPFTPLILSCKWETDEAKTGFKSVSAGSGQAMGGKASFVLATVTSITLIMAACEGVFDDLLPEQHRNELERIGKSGKPCKAVFSETGDDIIMYDYYNRIESCLVLFGNTLNQSKSVYSTDYPAGEIHRFTEYLSRVSMNYQDCSRVSLKLCRLGTSHYTYAPHLLSHLWERNIDVIDVESFNKVWTKKSGPFRDKNGTEWVDNLKSILTLSNPTNLPHDLLTKLNLIHDRYTDKYIKTFPVRECLMLVEDILDKAKQTASDLKSNKDLLRGVIASEIRPLKLNDQNVEVLDIYWCEYLERTGKILLDIKKFVHSRSGIKKPLILSPYIIPSFMKQVNLEETILNLNLEDSEEELLLFTRLLVKDARSVDGSYPSFSDRSKHYHNMSSLSIRTLNASNPSFERLDAQLVLQSTNAIHRTGLSPDSYLLDPFGTNR